MKLPPEDGPADAERQITECTPNGATVANWAGRSTQDESALQQTLAFVRDRTRHDFTHYKRATVLRRIARRMQVNSLDSIPAYLDYLRSHADEAPALLHDLLIGVTHFFRDPGAFASLEANVPQLFAGKDGADQVRVWAPGCSTGEEAYTIAMLLCEHASKLDHPPSIQIFATDIDESAIASEFAKEGTLNDRSGRFARTVAPLFFQVQRRISGEKRHSWELILFAPHDVLRDPPF